MGRTAPAPTESIPAKVSRFPSSSRLALRAPEIGASRTPKNASAGDCAAISAASAFSKVAVSAAFCDPFSVRNPMIAFASSSVPLKTSAASVMSTLSDVCLKLICPSVTCQRRPNRLSSSVIVSSSAAISRMPARISTAKICSIPSSKLAKVLVAPDPPPKDRSNVPSATRRSVISAPETLSAVGVSVPRRSCRVDRGTRTSLKRAISVPLPSKMLRFRSPTCARRAGLAVIST